MIVGNNRMIPRSQMIINLAGAIVAPGLSGFTIRPPIMRGGTLVTIVPTREGLVIGADRRSNDFLRGDRDTAMKIAKAGRFTVVAETGVTTFDDPAHLNGPHLFDAASVASEYLRDLDANADLRSNYPNLAETLVARLRMTLFGSAWPHAQPDSTLLQLIVAHINRRTHDATVDLIKLLYQPPTSGSAAAFQLQTFRDTDLSNARPRAYGNVEAWFAISDRTNARFEHYRRERAIANLLGRRVSAVDASPNEAVAFIRAMTRANSAVLSAVDKSENHIGPTVDIALLDRRRGFRWIYRDRLARGA